MKRFLPVVLLVGFILSAQAQPISTSEANALLNVPVLSGERSPGSILPNIGPVCFDKKMLVLTTARDGRQQEVCLFINTTVGYIGFFTANSGEAGTCQIKADNDDFSFTMIYLKGHTYQYFTKIKNGVPEKKVVTLNSDFYYYPWGLNPDNTVLNRLNETGSYGHRRSRIQTRAYQATGSTAKFHLFGNNLPATITVNSSAKYLGVFGVGYASFGGKVYLMMDMLKNSSSVASVLSVENTATCFHSEQFSILDDEYYNKAKEKIRLDREKLMNQRPASGPCTENDLTIKNYKLEILRRQETRLEETRSGSLYIDWPAQKALMDMYNYEEELQLGIYEQEKKICKLEHSISRSSPASESSRRKLECYRRQLRQMREIQGEMEGIKIRFANNIPMQIMEKQKLMMRIELCN